VSLLDGYAKSIPLYDQDLNRLYNLKEKTRIDSSKVKGRELIRRATERKQSYKYKGSFKVGVALKPCNRVGRHKSN
jgi:hypothetical protein